MGGPGCVCVRRARCVRPWVWREALRVEGPGGEWGATLCGGAVCVCEAVRVGGRCACGGRVCVGGSCV